MLAGWWKSSTVSAAAPAAEPESTGAFSFRRRISSVGERWGGRTSPRRCNPDTSVWSGSRPGRTVRACTSVPRTTNTLVASTRFEERPAASSRKEADSASSSGATLAWGQAPAPKQIEFRALTTNTAKTHFPDRRHAKKAKLRWFYAMWAITSRNRWPFEGGACPPTTR